MIKINGTVAANYDRGWDIEPTCKEAEILLNNTTKQNLRMKIPGNRSHAALSLVLIKTKMAVFSLP